MTYYRMSLVLAVALLAAVHGPAERDGTAALPPAVPPAGLLFEDGFEGGGSSGPDSGFRWKRRNPGSRDVARTGSRSLKLSFPGNPERCRDATAEQRFDLGENLREVWLEYYVYLPKGNEGLGPKFIHRRPTKRGPDGGCSSTPDVSANNKWLRLWDVDYNRAHVKVGFEYRPSSAAAAGDSKLYGVWATDTRHAGPYNWPNGGWDPAITDALRGRWVQVRVHAKVADSKPAANGVLQLWTDGVLRIDMKNLDLAPAAGKNRFFRNGYLMGWANSGFDQTTSVYVDDFKVYRSAPGW